MMLFQSYYCFHVCLFNPKIQGFLMTSLIFFDLVGYFRTIMGRNKISDRSIVPFISDYIAKPSLLYGLAAISLA